MNPIELLEINIHRYGREATPADIARLLRVLADAMRTRDLAGWLPVAQGASQLHEALHASAAADAIQRAFQRPGHGK